MPSDRIMKWRIRASHESFWEPYLYQHGFHFLDILFGTNTLLISFPCTFTIGYQYSCLEWSRCGNVSETLKQLVMITKAETTGVRTWMKVTMPANVTQLAIENIPDNWCHDKGECPVCSSDCCFRDLEQCRPATGRLYVILECVEGCFTGVKSAKINKKQSCWWSFCGKRSVIVISSCSSIQIVFHELRFTIFVFIVIFRSYCIFCLERRRKQFDLAPLVIVIVCFDWAFFVFMVVFRSNCIFCLGSAKKSFNSVLFVLMPAPFERHCSHT